MHLPSAVYAAPPALPNTLEPAFAVYQWEERSYNSDLSKNSASNPPADNFKGSKRPTTFQLLVSVNLGFSPDSSIKMGVKRQSLKLFLVFTYRHDRHGDLFVSSGVY